MSKFLLKERGLGMKKTLRIFILAMLSVGLIMSQAYAQKPEKAKKAKENKAKMEKAEKKPQAQSSDIVELIKNEVKRQVKLELSNQKKKSKRKSQLKTTRKKSE